MGMSVNDWGEDMSRRPFFALQREMNQIFDNFSCGFDLPPLGGGRVQGAFILPSSIQDLF
jgi:hypothetical protein